MTPEESATLAVIQNDITYIKSTTDAGFRDLKEDMNEIKAQVTVNSDRIRNVERRQDQQTGISNALDGLLAVATAIGAYLGIKN